LFSLDLGSGTITQLTEYSLPDESGFSFTCVNQTRDEAYFWRGNASVALDLNTKVRGTKSISASGVVT
jgi:hypothetical protein